MIYVKSPKAPYGVNLPTSIKEVNAASLEAITKGIKLPQHYCIVALCFKTRLGTFALSISNKRSSEIGVVPVLAKIYAEDSKKVNANVGDKLIIDRSSLERGSHLNCDTCINSTNFRNYLASDSEMVKAIVTNNASNYNLNPNDNIVVLEFKIVPVCDIRAAISDSVKANDPFMNHSAAKGSC